MNQLRQSSRAACVFWASAIGATIALLEWSVQAGYGAYLAHVAARAPIPEMRELATRRLRKLLLQIPEFAAWVKEAG